MHHAGKNFRVERISQAKIQKVRKIQGGLIRDFPLFHDLHELIYKVFRLLRRRGVLAKSYVVIVETSADRASRESRKEFPPFLRSIFGGRTLGGKIEQRIVLSGTG